MSVENRKKIFEVAYVVYLIELLLFSSMYGKINELQTIFALVRNTTYVLVCAKVLLDFIAGDFKKNELVVISLVTILLIGLVLSTGNKAMLIYWVFIVAAHDIELEKIVKMAFIVQSCCLIVVIVSSMIGIIENRIYTEEGNRIRNSLGFQYTTESSNYYFYTVLMYIYLKKENLSWKAAIILGIFNYLLFRATDTRNAFVLGSTAIIIVCIFKISEKLRCFNFFYMLSTVLCVPILALLTIGLTFKYNVNIGWLYKLNNILNGRLALGNNAYHLYGVHWWGKRIQWIGGTDRYDPSGLTYNYVDSSYIQILLNNGLIFFLLMCVAFVFLGYCIFKKKDMYFALVLCFIAIHSAFDPQLLWMEFNPFIMVYSYFNLSKNTLGLFRRRRA